MPMLPHNSLPLESVERAIPHRGTEFGVARARTILIMVEGCAVAIIPWVSIWVRASHGHPVHWAGDFPTSAWCAVLVCFFVAMGLRIFLRTTKQLSRRIAVAESEAEAAFLDRIRSSVTFLAQTLLFLALMLSVR